MVKMNKTGICHICLEEKKLSFEHFPPESCFNDGKVKIANKISQRGIGDYTLCDSCNNNTGRWYVKDYKKLVDAVAAILKNRFNEFDKDETITGFGITITAINPLFCAKQMLVMMCSLMSIEEIKGLNISQFLLNKSSFLDGKEKFHLLVGATLKEDESTLFKGPMIADGNRKLYCLSSFPLRMLLVIGDKTSLRGYADFTEFLNSNVSNPITCDFNIGFVKNDLFDFINETIKNI